MITSDGIIYKILNYYSIPLVLQPSPPTSDEWPPVTNGHFWMDEYSLHIELPLLSYWLSYVTSNLVFLAED